MICNDDQQSLPQTGLIASSRNRAPAVFLAGDPSMNMDGAASAATNLDRYVHALRRNWFWCLLLGGFIGAAAGAAVFALTTEHYTAVAELRAYSRPDRLINDNSQPTEKFETYISNVKQLLQSRTILTDALRKTDVKSLPIVLEQRDEVGWLASELKVSNPKDSEVLLVSITTPDPNWSAILVNAVVESYRKQVEQGDRDKLTEKLAKLKSIHGELTDRESRQRNDLQLLAETVGSIDRDALTMQQQMQMEQAQQVKREYLKADIERMNADADLIVEKQRLVNLDTQAMDEEELEVAVVMDPEGRMIINELDLFSRTIDSAGALSKDSTADQLAGLGGARYHIKELKSQLDTLKQHLTLRWKIERRRELQDSILEKEAQAKVLNDLCGKLQEQSDSMAEKVAAFGQKSAVIEMKQKDVERLGRSIDEVAQQISLTEIELEANGRLEVVSQAIPPRLANRPGRIVVSAGTGLLAFMLPCVGLMFWDVRSQRVNTANEITERLGLPIMGSVPILPSRITRNLGSSNPRGRWWQALLSESIAAIRANLLRVDDVRVVMVTSAVGGEGKTTVATQLAMSLARAGKRTALVDFDLPRPSVSTVFNLALEPGICDVLRGDCGIDDIVNDTVLPNLYVMPAGVADAASARAMNSEDLPDLMRHLRDSFDYVIVDGSPLVPVADARVVSRYVDGAICCVLRDVSRLSLIRRASEILESFNVRLLGTVVTARQETYYMSRNLKHEEHAMA